MFQEEKIRGKFFSLEDFELIKRQVDENFDKGITFISRQICEMLNWRQPNGWLKDRACREVLNNLEKKGYIELPISIRKIEPNKKKHKKKNQFDINELHTDTKRKINISSICFKQVKGTKREEYWNFLVNKYHYLGFKVFVGRSLKYFVKAENKIIAAVGFTDPVWSISIRDLPFSKIGFKIEELRLRGVNNGRFLILPWIKVQNLASHILSVAVKRLSNDWKEYYNIEPLYVETFVDPEKFFGTCYKAANWLYLGVSKGFVKSGNIHKNKQKKKIMFIHIYNRKMKKFFLKVLERKNDAIFN